MVEEASFQFRFKKIVELKNLKILDEINYIDLMSEDYQNTCNYLNYAEHLLILASTFTCCVSIFAFGSLVCAPVGIVSSAIGLKICAITANIKRYKSVIKKNKKKHDKIVLLEKDKSNTIEVLISKSLIDSYISHGEFASVNNVLKENNEIKKEIINPKTSVEYAI